VTHEFPEFDTGSFEGAVFSMDGGSAQLVLSVAGIDDIVVRFEQAHWHEFTALTNCSAAQIESAYFKLAELENSDSVLRYVAAADKSSVKAYRTLRHFRVFVDEHGCHEVFAETASVSRRPKDPRAGA
jgi:hypothetical protein